MPVKPAYDWLIPIVFLTLLVWPVLWAKAEETGKDLGSTPSLKEIEETIEEDEDGHAEAQGAEKRWHKMIQLDAFVELNYEYSDVSDIENEDSGPSSDFFIGTLGVALEIFFNTQSSARIALEAEDVGQQGGWGRIIIDEAFLSLRPLAPPFYLILGKKQLPFGVFENHLIDGPLTEDLYEINEIGATLGITLDFWRLNVSCSVYKNPTVLRNLEDFNTHDFAAGRNRDDRFRSYIANVTFVPLRETLFLSASYNSEPGHGSRNRSIGGAITLVSWELKLDLEYITALNREKDEDEQRAKESAWVVGLAYELLETLELAARYEVFDDDRFGDQDEVVKYRMTGGVNYSLWEYATLSMQYSFSRYEKETDDNAADAENLFQIRLTLEI